MPLMARICEDIGAGGEDEMIDMQARIGSYSSLQRRLTEAKNVSYTTKEESYLFGDLFPGNELVLSTKSHSTRESLSGMSNQGGIFSEEELHE